jgi:hypothetical protein
LAKKIAKAYFDEQEFQIRKLADLGVFVDRTFGGRPNRTFHDQFLLGKAGFDTWAADVQRLADARTWDGVPDRMKMLRDVYENLYTGNHPGGEGYGTSANIANRLKQERVLEFTADKWWEYEKLYGGKRSLAQTFDDGLKKTAGDIGLIQKLGTNPGAMVENLKNDFGAHLRSPEVHDLDGAKDLFAETTAKDLQRNLDAVTGANQRTQDTLLSTIGQTFRAIQTASKLGMVAFTHGSAAAPLSRELGRWGMEGPQRFTAFFQNFMKLDYAAREQLLAGTETYLDSIMNEYANEGLPGVASNLAAKAIKVSGLEWLLDRQRVGTQGILANYLGKHIEAGTAFDMLPRGTKMELQNFRIGESEWNLLKSGDLTKSSDGAISYLTAQAARSIPDAAIGDYLKNLPKYETMHLDGRAGVDTIAKKAAFFREDLAMRLQSAYTEAANRAVVTPGAYERAQTIGRFASDTAAGEFATMMFQFKMWPWAAITRNTMRDINGAASRSSAVGAVAENFATATVMGALIVAMKDMAKGVTPQGPTNPDGSFNWDFIRRPAAQGAGLGLISDIALGEWTKERFAEHILGPTIGAAGATLDNIRQAKNDVYADKPSKVGSIVLDAVKNNTPLANMWFAKAALDYMVWWNLKEYIDPGSNDKMENNLAKRGQKTIMRPMSQGGGSNL